jgi:DNA-binding transcriptional LysR family regulator
MRNLDLGALRTFVAVAETRTFEHAGSLVGRTQPAVSQQMRRLEDQAGVRLFRRSGRNNELTPAGVRLVGHARRILAIHDEAYASLHRSGISGGLVRIGAVADVVESLLPDMLRRFMRIDPEIRIEAQVGHSASLLQLLRDGVIDLAISADVDEGLPRALLRRSPAVWIGSYDLSLGREEIVPLVLSPEPAPLRRIALDALERAGRGWVERCTTHDFGTLRAALRAGLGVTVRTVETLSPELRALGDRENLPPLGEVDFHLYLRKSGASAAARALFDLASVEV